MIISPRQNLGEILVDKKFLSPNKLKYLLEQTQEDSVFFEDLLYREQVINPDKMKTALEEHFGVPYVDLSEWKVNSEILRMIPEKVMKDYLVAAFRLNDNVLHVAMIDPIDLPAIDYLSMLTGYKVKPYITTERSIYKVMENYYSNEGVQHIVEEIEIRDTKKFYDDVANNRTVQEKPIVKLVDIILEQAVLKRVSDIHIEPQDQVLLIRFRKDGILRTVQQFPRFFQSAVTSRIKIMAGMNIAEKRLPADGQFRKEIGRRELDFRVSSLAGKYGEKIVIRVLDRSSFAMGLEALGFSPDIQSRVENMVRSPMGTFLVAGPTGSGKTTTLYSILSYIRSPEINIITFEDPIEYELLSGSTREGGITQIQVHQKIGLTFAEGLRASLRQDPDIIFVGEIRDKETAEMVATSSLTGHLVLSSVHTLDTITTVTRLLDLGVEPYLLSSTLLGILSQRLVRRLCLNCKEEYTVPSQIFGDKLPVLEDKVTLSRPKGCSQCSQTGYKGRIAVFELLEINEEIRRMIHERKSEREMYENSAKMGVKTLKTSGMELVYRGITSVGEVLRVLPNDKKI